MEQLHDIDILNVVTGEVDCDERWNTIPSQSFQGSNSQEQSLEVSAAADDLSR